MRKIQIFFTVACFFAIFSCNNSLDTIVGEEVSEVSSRGEAVLINGVPDSLPGALTYRTDRVDAFENDDNYWNAKSIFVNGPTDKGTQMRNFYDDPTDWIRFTAAKGILYNIESWTYGDTDTDLELYSSSSPRQPIASNTAKAPGNHDYAGRIVWMCRESGEYYVKVSSYNGLTGSNMGYAIAITTNDIIKDEFEENDIPQMASEITVFPKGSPIEYEMNFVDDHIDWVKFNVFAGEKYTIETKFNNVFTGSIINLWNSDGEWLDWDKFSGSNGSLLEYEAVKDEILYLRIFSDAERTGLNTDYRLKVTN